MAGTRQDAMVQCPYYREEDAQSVYCEGVEDGSRLRLGFMGRKQKQAYSECCCRSGWKHCRIAGMLNQKYDYHP